MQPITVDAPALSGRPILSQRWTDLVFLHWRVDAAEVASLLPAGIEPDVFDGSSWVGLIPFAMSRTRVLGGPPIPYLGSFTEINVRLYGVDRRGRRGVVFASLEASRLLAVVGARVGFSLPYHWAAASARSTGDTLAYRSARFAPGRPSTRIAARTTRRPVSGDPLADFLTARWLLFQHRFGSTLTLPNRHAAWELFEAELVDLDDGLVAASGIRSIGARAPDSVLWSPGVATDFGGPLPR